MTRIRTAAVLVAALSMLSACGGTDPIPPTGADAATPRSFDDIEFASPIGEFLGVDFGASERDQAEMQQRQQEAGRLTAECMAGLGFEYTPHDPMRTTTFSPGDDLPYLSDEWVDKYGFGITTQRFAQSAVGDLVGFPDEASPFGDPAVDQDPNAAYVDSLSDGEREAYFEALYGQPPEFGPEGPSEDFVFEPSGCEPVAFEQVFDAGDDGVMRRLFEVFGDDLRALEQRIRSDSRLVEFNASVAGCVAEQGLLWVDQEELYQRFETRLDGLDLWNDEDPFVEAGLDPEEMTDREIEEFFAESSRLGPAELEVLAELQSEEIALAKAVTGCGGGPLNQFAVVAEVRVEYEQAFVDAHQAELETLRQD